VQLQRRLQNEEELQTQPEGGPKSSAQLNLEKLPRRPSLPIISEPRSGQTGSKDDLANAMRAPRWSNATVMSNETAGFGDLKPLGTPVSPPPPRPYDPHGDDPQDEEQEEDDQACALEMGMKLPTLRPTESTTSVTPTSTAPTSTAPTSTAPISTTPMSTNPTSIAPTSTTSEPPKPDPNTEKVHCFNSGPMVTSNMMRDAIKRFCNAYGPYKVVLDDSAPGARNNVTNGNGWGVQCVRPFGCFVNIQISATATNKFRWELGIDDCFRILKQVVDGCDKSSTKFKQGGTVDTDCSKWYIGKSSCVVRIWKI
jgi:hypothetical protein